MQRNQNKTLGFIKLAVLAISLAIVGSNYQNLFPTVTVAHGSASGIQLKTYLRSAPIIVAFKNSRWIANRFEIRRWIKTTNGSTSIDPSSFVNSIAGRINIPVTRDRDGRSVDTANLTRELQNAVTAGRSRTIALPVSTITRGNTQAGRFPGRYIDINLSEQTLYAFDNTNLVNRFLVSTGRRGYATPTGEFHIYGKDRRARMHGPDYYLPNVPYISWFQGDYSIHGTYWHHNFGHVMSHGCVNASIPDAGWIYDWAGIGTPIYIHY